VSGATPSAARRTAAAARGDVHQACSHTLEDDRSDLVRIGAVARRLGVSERTLRYYEEVGLVHPAQHEPGGSRRYCEADVARIQRIREMQELLGFNLDEIRTMIGAEDRLEAIREEYRAVDDRPRQRRLIEAAYHELTQMRELVAAKAARLDEFLGELDARIARHRTRLDETPPTPPRRRASRAPSAR
jgi:DNA-binding transcriptional MerR regulator